jgi:hypothetical protein
MLQVDSTRELELACPLVAGLHLPQSAASSTDPATAAAADAAAAAAAADDDAQLAVESAMMLLQLEPAYKPSLLSMWIAQQLHAFNDSSKDWILGKRNSSSGGGSWRHAKCVARTKAVLAAVAAAPQVPAGAQQLTRKALLKVLDVGDADFTAVVLMWACRLEPRRELLQQQQQQQDEAAVQPWWLQLDGLQELLQQQLMLQQEQAI